MEQYEDVIKRKFNDSSFQYRADAFREFIRAPVRTYKESPTVKDYVELREEDLDSLLLDPNKFAEFDGKFAEDADIRFLNDSINYVSEEMKKKGIMVMDFLSAAASDDERIKEKLYNFLGQDREEFLVNASFKNGIVIFVPDGARDVSIQIETFLDASAPNATKSLIIIGEDSSVKVSDTYRSYSSGKAVQAKSIYLHLGKRSKLQYNYLQEKSQEIMDLSFVRSFLDEFSEFTFFHVNRGASRVIFSNLSYMEGEGSSFRTFGVSYSDSDQKFDIRDSSFQTGKACNADIQVRGVVKGKSVTLHRGNIDIEEKSVKSTGFYDSRILLLSKDGYANSKPGLIIRNSDTKSKHASAISSLNSDQILYLRSRGIPRTQAVSMLTEGFLLSNLEKSGDDNLIEKVHLYSEEILNEPESR